MPQTDPFEAALAAAAPPASDPFEAALATATPAPAAPPLKEATMRSATGAERFEAAEGLPEKLKVAVDEVPIFGTASLRDLRGGLESVADRMKKAQAEATDPRARLGWRVARSPVDAVAGLANPQMVGITAGSMLAGPFAPMLSAYFATDMGRATLEKMPEVADAVKAGKYDEAAGLLTDAGITGWMAHGAAKHGLGREVEAVADQAAATPPAAEAAAPEAPAPSKVTMVDVPSPEERAASHQEAIAAGEKLELERGARKAAALDTLRANLPPDAPIPEPPPESETTADRYSPSLGEREEIARKASYTGSIHPDELPESTRRKIAFMRAADDLAETLQIGVDHPPGRYRNEKNEWTGSGSMVPPELQHPSGGAAWQLEVLRKGINDEPMVTPKKGEPQLAERFHWYKMRDYLERQAVGRKLAVPELQHYFDTHGIEEQLTPVKEQVDAQKAEREAIVEEVDAEPTFDPAELESLKPAGASTITAASETGAPLNPLMPPDRPLRETVNRIFQGLDPEPIAAEVARLYGIKEPIQIAVDPMADVPRTELLEDGSLKISLPTGWEPYQVVHELGYEGRKFTGRLVEDLGHDNNLIAGRFLGDWRADGGMNLREDGFPETGFQGGGPNPLSPVSGRSWDLDQPFAPTDASVEAPVPQFKNVFDPEGAINPENAGRLSALEQERKAAASEQIDANLHVVDTETFHKALRDWQSDWLREKGFDAFVWQDELGRHVTEIPRTPEHVPGGPAATDIGEPYQGAPEEARIGSDFDTVADATTREAEMAGQPVDLAMQIPLLSPFIEHSAVPFAKNAYLAMKQTAVGLAKWLHPNSFIPDTFLDGLMKGLAIKNSEFAMFRMNTAIRKARSLFDQLPESEQIEFLDRFKTGQAQPNQVLTEKWHQRDLSAVVKGKPAVSQSLDEMARTITALEEGWYDKLADEMDQNGKSLAYIENHLALFYEDPVAAEKLMRPAMELAEAKFASKRPLEGSKGFMRKMIYETASAAQAAGLKLVSTNPFVLMELRLSDNVKFLSARKMFRESKANGSAKFVPASEERAFQQSHEGWVPIPDKISQVYFPTEVSTPQPTGISAPQTMALGMKPPREVLIRAGAYYWEPNVARALTNYLSRDLVRESKLGYGLLAAKNFTTAIELGIASFHLGYTNMTALAMSVGDGLRLATHGKDVKTKLRGGLQAVTSSIISPFGFAYGGIKYAVEGGKLMKLFKDRDAFVQSLGGQEWLKKNPGIDNVIAKMFEGGGTLGSSEAYRQQTIRGISESAKQGDYLGALLKAAPEVFQAASKPLFDEFIPRVKLGAFVKDFATELEVQRDRLARGEISQATLARRSWARVDNRLGEMNFDNLFWNRSMKSTLQIFMRSVTWKLGNIRDVATGTIRQTAEFVNPVKAIADNIRMDRQGVQGPRRYVRSPILDGDFSFLLGTALMTSVAGAVTQVLLTKGTTGTATYPWETDTPIQDCIMPRTGELDRNGNPARLMTPTYMRDWLAGAMHPMTYLQHSASALLGRSLDGFANKDFYGNRIYDPSSNVFQKAMSWLGHIFLAPPIAFQSFSQGLKTGGSAYGMAVSPFGFTPASPAYSQSPLSAYIADVRKTQGEASPGRSPEQAASREGRKEVQKSITEGYPTPAAALEAAGKAGAGRAAATGRIGAAMGPLAQQANSLNLEQLAKGIVEFATPEEAKKLEFLLQRKYASGRYVRGKPKVEQEKIKALVDEAMAKIRGGA